MWLGLAVNREALADTCLASWLVLRETLFYRDLSLGPLGSLTSPLFLSTWLRDSVSTERLTFTTLVRVEADMELHTINSCIYCFRKKNFSLIKFWWELKITRFLQRKHKELSSRYFLLVVHYLPFPPTFLFGTSSPLPWSHASGKNF